MNNPTPAELTEARELLATECENEGWNTSARRVREADWSGDAGSGYKAAVNAIVAALRTARQATPASASEAVPVADADELLDAYDHAVMTLCADMETGWNEGNCRAAYERRIRRLRTVLLRRLSAPASGEGQQGDDWRRWIASNLPESLHGLELIEVLDLLKAGGIAAEQEAMTATQQQAGQAVAWAWMHSNGVDVIGMTDEAINAEAWRLAGHKVAPLYTTPQTPDGYVLVPREPTNHVTRAVQIYRAMIAASEAGGGEVGNG